MDLHELPEKPEGWTRHMLMHMNFGEEGRAASFEIKDPEGPARDWAGLTLPLSRMSNKK